MASSAGGKGIGWLSGDVVEEILRRVDGKTLARAGCVCNEFGRMARDEGMWEDTCRSLCPSTALDRRLHHFISSSFGGFRKFYAHSFPFVFHKFYDDDDSHRLLHNSNGLDAINSPPSPSDFVLIVDVQYKQKPIYSKVLWGIPGADDLGGWFCNCPFRIDLLSFSSDDEEDAESLTESPTIAINADELPLIPISCIERVRKNERFWREEVMENMRLSWIVMDRRSNECVNVSSWSPLAGQRQHWSWQNDFLIRFGSILPPAPHNISPGKAVQCMILMKCRICGGDDKLRNLKIIELSLQLEDMAGGRVNGKNSLLVLERAVGCRRSTNHSKALKCYHRYLKAQSDLNEQRSRNEGRYDTLCILMGIAAFATLWYLILREKVAVYFNPENDYITL